MFFFDIFVEIIDLFSILRVINAREMKHLVK